MSSAVLAKNGDEREWFEKKLPELSTINASIELSIGCDFGQTSDFKLRQEDLRIQFRIEKAVTEEEIHEIKRQLSLKKQIGEHYNLPMLLNATAERIGPLLRRFCIGNPESGYPASCVSSEEWRSFLARCPNLEELCLKSCLEADDVVVDSLKNHQQLRVLEITGNDRVAGKVSNEIINNLCARVCKGTRAGEEVARVKADVREEDNALNERGALESSKLEEPDIAANSEIGASSGPPTCRYFPALKHLILKDQSAVSVGDFERLKSNRPDIRFCHGMSRGYAVAASMLGLHREGFCDTHPPQRPDQSRRHEDPFFDDYYADDYYADDYRDYDDNNYLDDC